MEKVTTFVAGAIVAGIAVSLIACVLAIPLMLLWNWTMPDVFGLKEITFFNALCLNLMGGILFRSTVKTNTGK
jgi:hypothetical protein